MDKQASGILGETLARAELARRGHAILATRHRTRFGEIDIVSFRDGVLVFVEVKARRSVQRGSAVDALSPRKQRRIAAMALDYLASHGGMDRRCRFDVVAIDYLGSARQTIRVIENAWQVDW